MQKAFWRVMFALVFILIFVAPLWALEKSTPRLITVTGEAEVQVVPNQAILTLGVETGDRDLGIAKRENDERIKRVLALAK
ncbi:MAG: SIMPL domain-containing protein, partial [Deltaproteobacteria bacterium]